jgi:polyisoprenyl-teichoic acid--peptidoglycan teichoic acid transferase
MARDLFVNRSNKQKKKKRKRLVKWILFPLLIIGLSTSVYMGFLYKKAESVINNSYKPVEISSKRVEKADPKIDNISILLIGVDESEERNFGEGSRTDALMVATLNEKDKSIKLVSIPRDSYVAIPGRKGKTKINHAHAYGGTELTIETVQELLDIPIDYYVKMNFNAFIDVVDSLGGIEAEVPYELYEQDSKDRPDAIHLKPGVQELDGEQALALARTRHYDSDLERGKRQQEIVKSVIKKTVSFNSIPKQSDVIEAVGKNMTTNLSFSEMTSLISYVTAGTDLQIDSLHLEGSDSMINSVYYYQLDEQSVENIIYELKTHLDLLDNASDSLSNKNDIEPLNVSNRKYNKEDAKLSYEDKKFLRKYNNIQD